MTLPSAIGYLRSDVSGARQVWDENQIRSLAKKFGYDLRKTIVFNATTDRPAHRLRVVVSRLGVDAVFVPSLAHFDGNEVPVEVVAVAAVITVSPQNTHTRRAAPADNTRR
ncbi:MAG: hypothetical protein JWN03_180 [Nocardia sp.]|uniref:hypothetical protein n=1 Tax=Nocardia sp. TaxID=1821 RepID=UPI00262A28C2|nr:hypothetical protein [Nocardia sp.]MCU1639905.1 hypothetical protein [Nocardia sp.]